MSRSTSVWTEPWKTNPKWIRYVKVYGAWYAVAGWRPEAQRRWKAILAADKPKRKPGEPYQGRPAKRSVYTTGGGSTTEERP